MSTHPHRRHIYLPRNFGERASDALANTAGSWGFVLGFLAVFFSWIAFNTIATAYAIDRFPFILANLGLSLLAGIQAPIILMAANRAARRDALRDDHEAEVVELLYQINQQQLEILQLLHKQIVKEQS